MSNPIKLKIEGFSDPAATGNALGSIDAMINPETYSRTYNVNYQPSKEQGAPAGTMIFSGIGQSDLELKLVIDGTGVIPLPTGVTDVDDYITKFKAVVYDYQGSEHRPNYVRVTWGDGLTFTGICLSFTTAYTLFKPDGTALRATINLKLSESTDYKTKAKEAKKSSPDLTHLRTVKAGDTLPLMAYRIYGNSSYYLEVARINGLSSFTSIKPGDQIYFPPVKK
jgi:LysM repeat protein